MFGLVKSVGALVLTIGVGNIVSNVIKATTPAAIGILNKVCIAVGSAALTTIISDVTIQRIEHGIDGVINGIKGKMDNKEKETN